MIKHYNAIMPDSKKLPPHFELPVRSSASHHMAQMQLQEFASALDNIPSYIYMKDLNHQYFYANQLTLNLFKCSAEELVGNGDARFFPPEAVARLKAVDDRVLKNGETTQEEIEVSPGSPQWHVYLEVKHPLYDDKGRIYGLCGISTDITERKQVEAALRESEERYRMLFDSSIDGVLLTVPDGRIMEANPAACKMFQRTEQEIVQGGRDAIVDTSDPNLAPSLEVLERTGKFMGELSLLRKDGMKFIGEVSTSIFFNKDGEARSSMVIRDVTQRKQLEEQVRHLAFYDELTNLPNRRLLNDRLTLAMAASKRTKSYGAVIFLDLDNFKPLNDTHGHVVGDLLLIEASSRLKSCVREIDTVARFGGDEFVVMLSELGVDKEDATLQAQLVAEKIQVAVSVPCLLAVSHDGEPGQTVEHQCTASIGVAMFINHEGSRDDILKWADAAMYQAKDAGRNQIRFYEPKTSKKSTVS